MGLTRPNMMACGTMQQHRKGPPAPSQKQIGKPVAMTRTQQDFFPAEEAIKIVIYRAQQEQNQCESANR